MRFRNRVDAGRRLADALSARRGQDIIVLAVPRGGIAVAVPVAAALGAPLDVIVVRKLGVPFQPELAIGAIGEGGVRIINDRTLRLSGVTAVELAAVEHRERAELDRQTENYRGSRPGPRLTGHTVIVVDDGIATGSTARAACQVARAQGATRVVLAIPVAPRHAVTQSGHDADEVVCLETPQGFVAIGEFYDDYHQISDHVVRACLEAAPGCRPPPAPGTEAPAAGHLTPRPWPS